MVRECEVADSGEATRQTVDLVNGLAQIDRQRDAVVVVQNGGIVGWAVVWQSGERWADVHPPARGQGIGEWLLKWSQWRAAALGADRIGQTIDDQREDVARWLHTHGYTARHAAWLLTAEAAALPHTAVAASPDDVDAALELFEADSAVHADRLPLSIEAWRAATVDRPGFVARDLLMIKADGRPVAAALLIDADEIWVDKLAVAAGYRGRGFAQDLLAAARSRAFESGCPRVRLSTDSNAGTDLGMTVERSFTQWALDL